MKLTQEQQAVVDHRMNNGEMLKCVAFAGAGKTSTFIAYANANPDDNMLYLAFNKSVETEAKSKFPSNVRPKTVHALAWASKGREYKDIASNVRYFHVTKRLKVDVYAATLICQTLDNWLNSADEDFAPVHAAPDFQKKYKNDITSDLLNSAKVIWHEMIKCVPPFQMTHSGYLKLYQLSQPRLPQGVIMLDEAQDSNPVTFDIVNRQRQFGARVLLAGDPYQQIYSWRGAVDAMSNQDCTALYLTQSFRFGNAVARVANKILNTFFNEEKSLVGNGKPDSIVSSFPAGEKFTIICRTNTELFTRAVDHATANQHIHVIGEQGFKMFLDSLLDVYALYCRKNSEVKDRSLQFFRDYDEFKKFANDRADAEMLAKISIVEKYSNAMPRHVERIRQMNGAEAFAQVILVTAHKAKGLEWDNVMLANDFTDLFTDKGKLVPIKQHVMADKSLNENARKLLLEDAVEKDEINLLYVAATRAKRSLLLNGDLSMLMHHGENFQHNLGRADEGAPVPEIEDDEDESDY
jgi:F-box protein 18 (helicase)